MSHAEAWNKSFLFFKLTFGLNDNRYLWRKEAYMEKHYYVKVMYYFNAHTKQNLFALLLNWSTVCIFFSFT